MTRLIYIASMALAICLTAQAQELGTRLVKYEAQKKDVGTALLFSSLLPGGGLFYAGEVPNGIAFLSFETADLLLLFERRNSGNPYGIYVATLIILKTFEYLFAVRDVGRYNDQLRSSIGLTISVGPRPEPRIMLSFAI